MSAGFRGRSNDQEVLMKSNVLQMEMEIGVMDVSFDPVPPYSDGYKLTIENSDVDQEDRIRGVFDGKLEDITHLRIWGWNQVVSFLLKWGRDAILLS